MNVATFLPVPILMSYAANLELFYVVTFLAVSFSIAAKFIPYIYKRNGVFYYRYSPFFPAVTINKVDINDEGIKIDGNKKMVYQYEDISTKKLLAAKIDMIKNSGN